MSAPHGQAGASAWLGSSSARYAVLGEIATGGMATVYLGKVVGPAGFTRTVAIKRPHPHLCSDPDLLAMFLDEARLAAHVRHPNVVGTLDVLAGADGLAIVLEYVHGVSLAEALREASPPEDVAVAIVSAVLQGLHAAHEATDERGRPLGLVHRDVSPHNVLVDADGAVRVADFGIAKVASATRRTQPGRLKGKLGYMAPEQLDDQRVDRRADIYSAAVVAWEALTGRRLFSGMPTSKRWASVSPPSVHAPHLPAALDDVLMRGLDPDRERRFETAREMAVALEGAVAPAPQRRVGEWIEVHARRLLDERSRRLEAALASGEAGAASDPRAGATPASEAPTFAPGLGPQGAHDGRDGASPPDPTSLSQTTTLALAGNERSAAGLRRAAVIVAAATAAAVAVALALGKRTESPTPDRLPVAENTTATHAAGPPSSPEPGGAAAPEVSPGASAETREPATAPTAQVVARRPAGRHVPPSPQAATPAPSARPAAAGCSPPYVFDATTGVKRYKPECL